MFDKFKKNPVTSILGFLGGVAVALSQDPLLTGETHADGKTWAMRIAGSIIAALGLFSSDAGTPPA